MVSATVSLLALLVLALLIAGVYIRIKVRREQARTRPVVRVRHVIGPLFLVVAVALMAVTPIGGLSFDLSYQVSASENPSGDAIPINESASQTLDVPLEPLPGTTYVVRGQGVSIESWQREASTMQVSVMIPPNQESGTHSATLQFTPYPAILPEDILQALHDRSPLAAMVGSAATVLVPLYLLARLLLDGDRPLFRTRNRWLWRRLGDWP